MKGGEINMNTIFAIANREVRETSKGFQLFETCTCPEGAAISPVFKTMKALCVWAEKNATIWADRKISAAAWMEKMTGDVPPTMKVI